MLVWVPVLLLGPVLNLHGDAWSIASQAALILTLAAATVTAALTSHPSGQRSTPYVALGVAAAATALGSTQGSGWLPTWILLAVVVPSVLRGWWVIAAIPVVALASMWAASYADDGSAAGIWSEGFVVLLAGVTTASFLRLIETIEELRRTREELARVAVAEERERFSRDLHDLLGHTLSVIVVKAQAVRRLVDRDPAAAAAHGGDIERVGREALVEIRQAVDGMRALTLDEELDRACRALQAAGIRAEVSTYDRPIPNGAEQAFAWAVREGVTNVLRHSGAGRCQFDLRDGGGRLVLTIADDGVGAPAEKRDSNGAGGGVRDGNRDGGRNGVRDGGLDGLRRRLVAAGGRLDVDPDSDGFRLTAEVPVAAGPRS